MLAMDAQAKQTAVPGKTHRMGTKIDMSDNLLIGGAGDPGPPPAGRTDGNTQAVSEGLLLIGLESRLALWQRQKISHVFGAIVREVIVEILEKVIATGFTQGFNLYAVGWLHDLLAPASWFCFRHPGNLAQDPSDVSFDENS
jgi:hypothetical protein